MISYKITVNSVQKENKWCTDLNAKWFIIISIIRL